MHSTTAPPTHHLTPDIPLLAHNAPTRLRYVTRQVDPPLSASANVFAAGFLPIEGGPAELVAVNTGLFRSHNPIKLLLCLSPSIHSIIHSQNIYAKLCISFILITSRFLTGIGEYDAKMTFISHEHIANTNPLTS